MTEPEFDLFISYARRDSQRVVQGQPFDVVAELKAALESHRRPGDGRRFRVCTDVDDFTLGDTFDTVMRGLIGRSRAFLVVCGPGALQSSHVAHELSIVSETLPTTLPRLAAVLGAAPADVAADLFLDAKVAADLTPPQGATRREWRRWLLRESHKIVARAWGLDPRRVHDRFAADLRAIHVRIASAVGAVAIAFAMVTVILAGDLGYHRVAVLELPERVIAPAGVGFAVGPSRPLLVHGDDLFVWDMSGRGTPTRLGLPFPVLRLDAQSGGMIAIAGLRDVGLVHPETLRQDVLPSIAGKIEDVAISGAVIAASNDAGDMFILETDGTWHAAPRPLSVAGRRFPPVFRDRGPFRYGSTLAMSPRYIASATLTGHLGVLDRRTGRFVTSLEPTFPPGEPLENSIDPILYETPNTRPIGALAFLSDTVLVFSEGDGLRRIDLETGKLDMLETCAIELVRQIVPLPGGRRLLALTSSTLEVLAWDPKRLNRLECHQRTTLAPKSSPRAALAQDGRTLLIGYFDGAPELWRPTFQLFGRDLWPW